jgi:hypothetical protein
MRLVKQYLKNGKEIYEFAIGKEEMLLLRGIIKDTFNRLPKIFEFTIVRGRLRNFKKTLEELK